MSKKLKILAVVAVIMIFAAGCNSSQDTPQKPELQKGKLDYETIDVNSEAFKELYKGEAFKDWYEENFRQKGAHSFEAGEDRYILLSAGEKNTDGYSIDNIVLTGKDDEIEVTATLKFPSDKGAVAQTLTYPQVLLRIAKDTRPLAFADFQEAKYEVEREALKGTGRYSGMMDQNSVEIEVKNASGEYVPEAFRLEGDETERLNFEEQNQLQSGDEVSFTYIVDEYQRNVLKEISKL